MNILDVREWGVRVNTSDTPDVRCKEKRIYESISEDNLLVHFLDFPTTFLIEFPVIVVFVF